MCLYHNREECLTRALQDETFCHFLLQRKLIAARQLKLNKGHFCINTKSNQNNTYNMKIAFNIIFICDTIISWDDNQATVRRNIHTKCQMLRKALLARLLSSSSNLTLYHFLWVLCNLNSTTRGVISNLILSSTTKMLLVPSSGDKSHALTLRTTHKGSNRKLPREFSKSYMTLLE